MTERSELTNEEWQWLVKISRHDAAFLTVAMDKRLKELGLVEEGLGGAVVSREGRNLLARELAPSIRARKAGQRTERKAGNDHQRLMDERRGR